MNFSEESKPDSDVDEPWNMTVKGINSYSKQQQQLLLEDPMLLKHNGPNNLTASRDANLNHYKVNQVCLTIIKISK